MRFLASISFVLLFSFSGFAQQEQNHVKNPNEVQRSQKPGSSPNQAATQPGQKPVMDFNKVVPSKGTARQTNAQESKPRQLVPIDPDKVVKGKN